MKFHLSYEHPETKLWEWFRCNDYCGSMEFTRYDPKDSARYRCCKCQAIWYGSKAVASPIEGSAEESMAELKKRVTRGICALAGCSVKEGLFPVRVEGRKEQVDVCEPHAMDVVDVDSAGEPWIPLSKLAQKTEPKAEPKADVAKTEPKTDAAEKPKAPTFETKTPKDQFYWTGNEYKPNPDYVDPAAEAHLKAEQAESFGAPDAAVIRAQAEAQYPPTKAVESPAAAPPAAAPSSELTVSASVNQTEIQAEASEVAGFLTELEKSKISSSEELVLYGELLADVKGRNNRLEALKQTATKPLNEALTTIRSWFKPTQDLYARAEIFLKKRIADYHDFLKAERAKATAALNDVATSEEVTQALVVMEQTQKPEVAGLQVREVWDFEIVDADQLPRLYLQPNEKVIRAQISLGVREIPGVRIFVRQQVASRAS